MTNKQTIDGVSRALLKGILYACKFSLNSHQEEELRALLDKPVCCKISDADQALLDAGDYTPEELFGVGGKPSCPDCSKPAAQPQGEVERLRAKVNDLRQQVARAGKAYESTKGILQRHTETLSAQLAERDALLREARLSVEEAADPDAGGPTRTEAKAILGRIDAALSTSAEPKLLGEPVAELQVAFYADGPKATLNWFTPSAFEPGVTKLYAEQPAPLADEAAKAFAKGFNTLETGGGKYRINMQFQSREDAWGACNVLARLKQLNTPQ
ncbi:hypothetical protein ACTXNP_01195 [Pseudomonas helleri]|uniref:hypothetical protein n=1 Tax=Pseudomonas helleri TaxID=1608996 RepID=UPI003FD51E07